MAEPKPFHDLHNPKRGKESREGRPGWYEYYAGFSPNFVQDALKLSGAEPGSAKILDPWNGSGTTTEMSLRNGFESLGFDLNPAMVIVAKGRMLQPNVHQSVTSLLEEILLRANTVDDFPRSDPLEAWLSVETASLIRRIEFAVQTILVDAKSYTALGERPSLDDVSALAAFFYVALFRVLRKVVKPFASSNPTWIKEAETDSERVHIETSELSTLLRAQVIRMAADLAVDKLHNEYRIPDCRIDVASSRALPIDSNAVHLVITSPPYCTRIDYVMKTGPELALLGLGQAAGLRQLRDQMIGTPTIGKEAPTPDPKWGTKCLEILNRISNHTSKASKSYYLKTYVQYFDGLYQSIAELDRVLARTGQCFFVVQDSYYKELRIDLAGILVEMARSMGWCSDLRRDFRSLRTMAGVNSGARAYGNPHSAVESVVHFSKATSL